MRNGMLWARVLSILAVSILMTSAFPAILPRAAAELPSCVTSSRGHWEGYYPSGTSVFINQSIETHTSDAYGFVKLVTNVNETTYDSSGVWKTSLAVLAGGNTRVSENYGASYWTDPNPLYFFNSLDFKEIKKLDGTKLGNDEGTWIDLYTPFPYYGAWYDKLWVTSNGFVVLDTSEHYKQSETSYYLWTTPIPSSFPITLYSSKDPITIVAPWWRDLNPLKCPSDGGIFYGVSDLGWPTIVWWKVPNNAGTKQQSFAVSFQRTDSDAEQGIIRCLYKTITTPDNGDRSYTSVGLQGQSLGRGRNVPPNPNTGQKYFKSGDVFQLTCTDLYAKVKLINVSAYKYVSSADTDDPEAAIDVGGWGADPSVPAGMNVERGQGPVVGGYSQWPEVLAGAGLFCTATASASVVLGPAGFLLGAAALAWTLYESAESTPRGSKLGGVKYASSNPAFVQNYALDNWSIPNVNPYYTWDVSIAPKLTWMVKDSSSNAVHRLVIHAKVVYCDAKTGSGDRQVETTMELRIGPSGVSGGATWFGRASGGVEDGKYYNFYPLTSGLPSGVTQGWGIDTNGFPPDASNGYEDVSYDYMGVGQGYLGYRDGFRTRADGTIAVAGWFKQADNYVNSPGVRVYVLNSDLQGLGYSYGTEVVKSTDAHDWLMRMVTFSGLGNQKVKIGVGAFDSLGYPDTGSTQVRWADTRVYCYDEYGTGVDNYCLYVLKSIYGSIKLSGYPNDDGYGLHPFGYNGFTSITATAIPGYKIGYWIVDGAASYFDQSVIGVTMTRDHTVEPIFILASSTTYKLTITTDGHGVTNPTTSYYQSGTKVSVTATAYGGYRFYAWYLDGKAVNGGATITVTMDKDHTLYATFARTHKG